MAEHSIGDYLLIWHFWGNAPSKTLRQIKTFIELPPGCREKKTEMRKREERERETEKRKRGRREREIEKVERERGRRERERKEKEREN